jgi:hypothetical protein
MSTKTVSVVTDKDIFYYIWDQMVKQNYKAVKTNYEIDDYGQVIADSSSDEMQYYSFDENGNVKARCAIGFIISKNEYLPSIEDTPVYEDDVINMIIQSNEMWHFTLRSKAMLLVLQYLHDQVETNCWEYVFRSWQSSFDMEGNFIGADRFFDHEQLNSPLSNSWLAYEFLVDNHFGEETVLEEDDIDAKAFDGVPENILGWDSTIHYWASFIAEKNEILVKEAFKELITDNAIDKQNSEKMVEYVPQKLNKEVFAKIAENILIHAS